MRPSRLLAFLLVSSAFFIIPRVNARQKSLAPAQKYVACWAANLNAGFHTDNEGVGQIPQKKYYSGIFTATAIAAQRAAIQNAFTKYLVHTYPNDNTGPGRCGFYDSEDAAQGWLNTAHTDDNSNNRQIFDTGWVYGSTTASRELYGVCYVAGQCFTRTRVFRIRSADRDSASKEWQSWIQSNAPQCGFPINSGCDLDFSSKAQAENNPNNYKLTDWLPSVAQKDSSH